MIKIETIMKANFNIEKNVRNSRSISALSALRKLQSLGLLLCALMIGSLQVWGADVTGLIEFGSGTGKTQINSASVTGDDSQDNTWTITTVGTTSFTSNSAYYQVGSSSKPATSITFTTTLPSSQTITSFSAKFGGFSGTAGTITLKVGDTSVGSGSLSATSDVTVTNSSNGTGTVLTVTVTGISKGVKCYYISYTYSSGPTLYTVTFDANGGSVSPASATQASAGAAISLPTPTRAGFNCTGWYTATSGGTKRGNAGGSYTPTSSETIHAQWSAKTYSNYRTLCTPPSDPSITVSPASITNLDYIVGQGPSAAQNITLGGSNLTASITITAPTNFEVSTDGGSTYGDSRTVTQTGGEPDVTTVKVRLKADRAVNTYGSSNVTFESTGATTQNVAVTGHVFKPLIEADPSPVSWSTSVGVAPSTTSVSVTGTNLKANITAVKGGTNASDFTISPASITQTSGSASGSITITYTGAYNAVTTKTATLTLSSTDADDVVVNITFNVIVDPNLYFLTDLDDIGPKDKVIIVSSKDVGGADEEDFALKNATTSSTYPPDAVDVESMIAVGRATLSYSGTDLQWNINYNSVSGEFTINRDGDDEVFLYCRDDNKGLSVGTTGDYNVYNITSDYIKCKDLTRYLGVYNSDDWRTYTSTGGNIADQTFTFYVQPSTNPYVTLGSSFSEFTYEYNHGPSAAQSFTVSGANLAANLVVTAPTNYEVCKTSDGSYTSSVSFAPSTGTVSEQTVYIRLASGLAVGSYNYALASGLSVTSTGADAVKAALTGSVTPESFTVTATSSNVSHGTVSPASQSTTSNMTITASPVDGYRVVSGAGGYTVTAGTATVVNNGDNTFTVTPSTDCTVRINFEAIPTHKVAYWASGVKIQESDVREGAAIPDQTTKTWVQLADYCATRTACVGWCTNPDYSHATDAPTGMITTMSPGGTMSTSDVNYYAVFANSGGSSNTFSRVTSLSQLGDGDVIAIVAEQSGGQIFGTGADHKGGAAPSETDGKITVSAATNKWTLEASSTSWKLLKDNDNKLCADLTYTAYGNTFNIVDALTANYFFIKSSSKALEYYNSTWQFYTISDPANSTQNGNVRLKLYKNDPGYIEYATNCACPGYSMHFGTRGSSPSDWSDKDSYCFVASEDADGNTGVYWYLEDFELPAKPHFYVGWEGLWNTTDAKSADADFSDLCFGLVRDNQFSCGYKTLGTYSSGNNQGAIGTLRVRSSYTDANKYIDFIPGGYVLRLSENNGSTYASTELVAASANLTETVWMTEMTTVSAALASSGKYFVDLKTSSDHVWAPNISEVANISSMGYKKDGGSSAGSWGTGLSSGMRGKFRIWADNCAKNWNCHFVPYYHLSYDGNGAGATNLPEASDDKSCEGDNSARTVSVSSTVPTRDGYTFIGWNTQAGGGGTSKSAGDNIVLTSDVVLYAQWAQNYNITYDRVGGTNVCANETCGAGLTYTVCGTEPTKSGYIFSGWLSNEATPQTYAAGATFTMPAANVTLTAQWTANWRNLTFNVPTGGGSITGGPAGNHVLDNHTFTFPTITGKSDAKWCWTFVGWTETAPNGSGTWDVTPSYVAGGATSGAITSDKTYYAVYSKTGAGASGTVELTSSDISRLYTENVSGTENIPYGTSHSVTATDGSVWTTTGQQTNGNKTIIQVTNASGVWIQLPVVGGEYNSITISHNSNSSARSIAYRTAAAGSDVASATTAASSSGPTTITISSGGTTGGYIVNTSGYQYQISGITASYGPPAVYGYTLDDCPCVVEEFDLTYDANATNFPGSTTSCTGVTDYRWEDHENEYTICSTEPTLEGYKFTHWATNANGSGTTYDAGEVITCVGETPITLYARYERVYTVTFNNQGVTTPVTQASEGATIAVPSATSPCSAEWAFVGWSETAIAPMSMLPTLEITAGTSTYTPTADKTLYAIYRKTSESSPFVAGMSGAYKISNGSTVYAGACNNSKLPETNAAGAYVFYIKYTAADGGKYTIQQADGKYLKYAGSSTSLALDEETPYYWTMTQNSSLWHVLGVGSGHYLQHSSGTGFKAYNGSGYTDIAFVAAEGQYYYRTMSCADEFDITFHDNGTTINWAEGHPEATYKDLADATVVSTFPTATFDGWTFLGWRTADYEESTTAPTASGIYSTGGNALTISSADVDLYPVFTRFEDNPPFDEINGGDYYIYFLDEGSDDGYGAARRVYASSYADHKRYNSTAICASATEFTFTKLENGNWTIYDKTTSKYLYAEGDDWLQQKAGTANAEWTLTVNGNAFDAYCVGTSYGQISAYGNGLSATFENYARSNIGVNPSYHRVYLGGCTNRTFTTNPSTTPYITMNGDVAPITSSQNGAVRATSVLSVSGGNLTPSTGTITISSNNSDIYFSLSTDKNFAKGVSDQPKSEVTITANGSGIVTPTPVYIHYKPSSNTDIWTSATITASYPGAVNQTATVELRTVKENFVIASKVGGNWYALPANMAAEGVFEPVLIDVDESAKIAYGPATVGYKMWPVQTVNGGTDEYAANGDKVRFAGNSNAGLWASNSNNHIRNWATITAIGSTAETPASYEWIIETEDREAYTLKSMYSTNYLDLYRPSSGAHAGKLVWASNSTYETNVIHFFPLTERAMITIIPREWKATGLVFSVPADNQITAVSYKIGTGSETSTTYTRHSTGGYGLYEVVLPDLTSQYGKLLTLKLTISGTPTYATTTIPIIVNANASTKTNEPFATLGAATKDYDVVVLDGKTLTTDAIASGACKFQNLYIYPGATLVNAANNNLSVRYLELRGGIKGIDHKSDLAQGVPHLKLDKNFSSTAGANLDMYVNTAHSYALSVPFDVTLSTVNFANSLNTETSEPINGTLDAQFMIMEYDGAQRASTGKGWKHITSTERVLHAGEGYVLQGKRPKGQPFAVIRFPFSSVSGWADGSGEVVKSPVSISEHAGGASTPDNDKGWNLIANPYMATLSYNGADEGWAADFTVGSLVKTDTDPWDGKYDWESTTNAYVTMPNEWYTEFPQYRANSAQAVFEPFKNFFIQASANGSVTFDKSKRASAPRHLLAQATKAQPIYADINLTHGEAFAQAGLTVDENATAGYKFGEDQNIFENREALTYLKVYTIADGHYLVGNTMTPAETEELIPVEFYAPNAGEYIFSLDDNSDIDRLEYVILYDAVLGLNTNLLTNDYMVDLEETGLIENRFSIGLRIKEKDNSATGIGDVSGDPERPYKFIYRDKMYILRGGKIYDATGKQVKEINK